MKEKLMKKIIEGYIKAYNEFDAAGMVRHLHRDMIFRNIANGEVTLELNGRNAFKDQITQAFALFKKREMKILEQKFEGNTVENKVSFKGVLALDVSEELKKYDLIKLENKSVFKFKDGKVISIEDIN
ncbi:nuclear transport factor 2 family protein [Methanobacterium sp. ACI-7]|uniref:nuclear transport factor 2 family protein n=1 Tax=unclassified Methanobacterium TaxID=2627676 RepID=UPI0039C32803